LLELLKFETLPTDTPAIRGLGLPMQVGN
jgi:hypothetical protein